MSWPAVLQHHPDAVIAVAARMSGIAAAEIIGTTRERPVVTVRHLAMAACREVTTFSLPAIARSFGDRDHTTVMHAVQKVKKDPALSKDCAVLVEEVRRSFATMERPGTADTAPGCPTPKYPQEPR